MSSLGLCMSIPAVGETLMGHRAKTEPESESILGKLQPNSKLGLACLAKLKPIFSKHAQRAKDVTARASTVTTTAIATEQKAPTRLPTHNVKLATLSTASNEWSVVVDDIAKFMYPSLNLEGHETDEARLHVSRLQWTAKKQTQNTSEADAVAGHVRLTDAEQTRWDFDRKLQVAECMLRSPLVTVEPDGPHEPSPLERRHAIARRPTAYLVQDPDECESSGSTTVHYDIQRTGKTRRKLRALAKQTTEAGKTALYSDKHVLLSKWAKLQDSRNHKVPILLDGRVVLPKPTKKKLPPGTFVDSVTPRTLFFDECANEQILPEPLLARISSDRALDLRHFGLGDTKAIALAKSLASLPSIYALNLADNRLTQAAVSVILQLLHGRKELRELNLSENEIGKEGCVHMADFLFAASSLTDLDLSKTRLLDAIDALAIEIAIHPSLLVVNLSGNEIGEAGGILLGETLAATSCTIQDLDLSWNQICLEGATRIGRALESNTSIHNLNLSMNRFGDPGGHAIASALLHNKTLQTLDLSRNNLTGRAAVTLSYAVQHNTTLTRLGLLNNDLGATGTKALLHAVASGIACDIGLSFRDSNDSDVFDAMLPSAQSPYSLDLKQSPYHYVIACELVTAAARARCELYEAWFSPDGGKTKVDLEFDATKKALVSKGGGSVFAITPKQGLLHVAARFVPPTIGVSAYVTTDGLANVVKVIKDRISTREMCAMLEIATFDMFLSLTHVELIVTQLQSALDVVEILARSLHTVVDGRGILSFLLAHLSFQNMNRLLASHGVLVLQFNPDNPTGRYTLDLANRVHRKLALWFAMLNRAEASRSMRVCPRLRGNTSQRGTFSNFRNEKFNGHAIEITDRFYDKLPTKGTLEFDYVSTTRPEDTQETVVVVDESAVNGMLQRIHAELSSDYVPSHKRLDMKRQVLLLQHALAGTFVKTAHVRMIMQYFPPTVDGLRLKVVLAAHRYIFDMENFDVVYEKLLPADRKHMFTALGYLNTLNPLNVDMEFDLGMTEWDNRVLVRTLVEMISNDPLDLIKLDDASIKLGLSIYSMFTSSSIPTTGRMGLRFISRPNKSHAELVALRQSTFHAFLFASRLRSAHPKVDDVVAASVL
ncbi:hypothetical protein SDRG_05764 [Saprolegnia diclina VS20]|uniref:Uncharacterized protein n=1 Tax=Saprolegnia diclina (strain VS20) TaxID=1156394 RepID=T0QG70_SAPDV|nr:hypothetical protein SDRG_05764 [Saprolegnia diclina VS20]EQC36939.1 hypothetical protein SDRG_05764 [Saprolegnia diclina VS20]|eukprot:XP_008609720.1 hypothetical protein SDRG_05764 [Saprolegnia diclina VS20]